MASLLDLAVRVGVEDNASGALKGIVNNVKGIAVGAGAAAGAAIGAATAGAVAFGKQSLEVGKNFDSAMSQVAATSRKTMEEFNSEVTTAQVGTESFTGTLRDFALYMGSKTQFSATEAAEALNYMALAGYEAQDSMTMLPNVLNLAAAGGISLSSASDMVTDAQSALGLSLEQTSSLVDQMAYTASSTNTSVAQLGEAILTVGGTAKQMAGGTEELSASLGILADSGIKGAEGGTALRNVLLSLGSPTDTAKKALDELGVSVYDEEGKMRSMEDIFDDLNTSLSVMTDEQKNIALNDIFNKTDLKAVQAFMAAADADKFDELTASIKKAQGSAEQMANTQMDNLAGDIKLWESALEGVQIQLSDKLSPAFRDVVKLATSSLGKIDMTKVGNLLTKAVEGFGKALDWLAGHSDDIMNAISGSLELVGDAFNGMESIVTGGIMVMDDILVGDFGGAWEKTKDMARNAMDGIKKTITKLISKVEEVTGLTGITEGFESAWNNVQTTVETVWTALEKIFNSLTTQFKDIGDSVSDLTKSFSDFGLNGENIWNSLQSAIELAGDLISDTIDTLGSAITPIIDAMTEAFSGVSETISNLSDDFADFGVDGGAVWETLKNAVSGASGIIKRVITSIGTAVSLLLNKMNDKTSLIGTAWSNLKLVVSTAWEEAKLAIETSITAITGILDALQLLLEGDFAGAWDKIKETAVACWEGIKSGIEPIIENVKTMFNNLVAWYDTNLKTPVETTFNSIKETISGAFTGGIDAIKEAWSGLVGWFDEHIVQPIKDLLDFEFTLPTIPLPHFGINPEGWEIGDLLHGVIPTLGVEWYANGGIMNSPTIFGMNGNNAMIGGEAGAEAIAPIETLQNYISEAVAEQMERMAEKMESMIERMESIETTINLPVILDGRKIGESAYQYSRMKARANG